MKIANILAFETSLRYFAVSKAKLDLKPGLLQQRVYIGIILDLRFKSNNNLKIDQFFSISSTNFFVFALKLKSNPGYLTSKKTNEFNFSDIEQVLEEFEVLPNSLLVSIYKTDPKEYDSSNGYPIYLALVQPFTDPSNPDLNFQNLTFKKLIGYDKLEADLTPSFYQHLAQEEVLLVLNRVVTNIDGKLTINLNPDRKLEYKYASTHALEFALQITQVNKPAEAQEAKRAPFFLAPTEINFKSKKPVFEISEHVGPNMTAKNKILTNLIEKLKGHATTYGSAFHLLEEDLNQYPLQTDEKLSSDETIVLQSKKSFDILKERKFSLADGTPFTEAIASYLQSKASGKCKWLNGINVPKTKKNKPYTILGFYSLKNIFFIPEPYEIEEDIYSLGSCASFEDLIYDSNEAPDEDLSPLKSNANLTFNNFNNASSEGQSFIYNNGESIYASIPSLFKEEDFPSEIYSGEDNYTSDSETGEEKAQTIFVNENKNNEKNFWQSLKESLMKNWWILLIFGGCVVVLLIVVIALCVWIKRSNRKRREKREIRFSEGVIGQ